jgi:putative transposase
MIKETYVMTVSMSVDPASFLREQLESASPDLLRDMVKTFADALMSAAADAVCGAPYGVRSDERTNSRNGYRAGDWDTWAGTVELAVPKLRTGSYFPQWLLTHRRRAEQALVSVVATSYLLRVSTRRVEKTRRTTRRRAAVQKPGQRDGHTSRVRLETGRGFAVTA